MMMSGPRALLFVPVLLVFMLVGLLGGASSTSAQAAPYVVNLSSQNNSGLSGTATLTDLGGGRTRVELKVSGPEGDYPAHVHMGTCANLNPAPQYPLANVTGGTSTTEINASLQSIQQSPHAINLHKSAQDLPTYVACGDVSVATSNAPAAPQAAIPSTAPAAVPSTTSAAPRARDGQTLATQSAATQAAFTAVWGDRAAARWVEEHDAALSQGGR
jgi:hypothetical protein